MREILRNDSFKQVILGIIVVMMVYFAFGLSTIDYEGEVVKVAHILMCAISSLFYYFFDSLSYKIQKNYAQVFKFNCFFLLITVSFTLIGIVDCILHQFDYSLISKSIFMVPFLVIIIKRHNFSDYFSINLKDYIGLLISILITLVLMYSPFFLTFKWDGYLYHEAFQTADFFKLNSTGFYGHISQGAGLIIAYLKCLFLGRANVAMYCLNAMTIVGGALAFWGIIRRLVPHKNVVLYTILTTMYMWSPWVLGMSDYVSIDFFCTNWFVIILYFTVSRQFFLQIVAGMVYAMVKEPAIIIYGSLCFGELLVDFVENKAKAFTHLRYYGMILVAIVWGMMLMFMGMWSMPGSEAKVEISHIFNQAAILYVFNFSWLIWGLVLCLFALLLVKMRKGLVNFKLRNLVIIFVPLLTFTAFSFLFDTVPNPRYTDIVPICGYVFLSVFFLLISKKTNMLCINIVSILLSVVMLTSSYKSIDPISELLYHDSMLGGDVVYTTNPDNHMYGDTLVYNKQALYMEWPIKLAIEDAIVNNWNILISGKDNEEYFFDGMLGMPMLYSGDYKIIEHYYDISKGVRVTEPKTNSISFEVCWADDVEAVKLVNLREGVYIYLYFDGIGSELATDIKTELNVLEEREYSSHGWIVHGLVLEKN